MDALIAAQVTDLIRKMGQSGDAAGITTLFAHLAKIEGYTDSIEGVLGTNADAAATNASIWAMLKTLNNKSTSPIKSIQRFTYTVNAVQATLNVAITAVNMAKTFISANQGDFSNGTNLFQFVSVQLTSPTNVLLTNGGGWGRFIPYLF